MKLNWKEVLWTACFGLFPFWIVSYIYTVWTDSPVDSMSEFFWVLASIFLTVVALCAGLLGGKYGSIKVEDSFLEDWPKEQIFDEEGEGSGSIVQEDDVRVGQGTEVRWEVSGTSYQQDYDGHEEPQGIGKYHREFQEELADRAAKEAEVRRRLNGTEKDDPVHG